METKIQKVIDELEGVQKHVAELSNIYEQNPELDDEISLENIVPLSLDEWNLVLIAKIEELKAKVLSKAEQEITQVEESYHGPEERRYAQLQG